MPIFKLVRALTKPFILAAENCCNSRAIERTPEAQEQVDQTTASMIIYQYPACPFCMITRRATKRLNLNIEYRDAKNDIQHKQTLINEGGKDQVPCLRIEENGETIWMYESRDIIDYLEKRFGENGPHNNCVDEAA